MRYFKYNKIVRDNIPDILKKKGIISYTKNLTNEEYWQCLKEKLIEETQEVFETDNKIVEEMADVLEVIFAMCKILNISFNELLKIKEEKFAVNGGFDKKVYVSHVELHENNENIEYYLNKKERYPEII